MKWKTVFLKKTKVWRTVTDALKIEWQQNLLASVIGSPPSIQIW